MTFYRICYSFTPNVSEPSTMTVLASSRANALAALTANVTVPTGHTLSIVSVECDGRTILQGS
jgi:hypothetical protein